MYKYFPWLVAAVAFYLLDTQSLYICDDLYFSFVHPINGAIAEPINSLADAIRSQCYDYFHENGRFLTQTMVHFSLGVLGLKVFHVLNAIVFAFLLAAVKNYIKRHTKEEQALSVIVLGVAILVPAVGTTFLRNVSLSVNYLWTCTAALWFVNLFETICDRNYNILTNAGLFVLAAVVG